MYKRKKGQGLEIQAKLDIEVLSTVHRWLLTLNIPGLSTACKSQNRRSFSKLFDIKLVSHLRSGTVENMCRSLKFGIRTQTQYNYITTYVRQNVCYMPVCH